MTFPATHSLWEPRRPAPRLPTLQEDLECDVAIIGAGITGLTAALRLIVAGEKVVVLEARSVASGVTSATSGHLTEAVDARYTKLESDFGKDAAHLVATSSRAAIEHVARLVDTLNIDCDFTRVPGYLYSEKTTDRDFIGEEYAAAHRAGLSVQLNAPTGLDLAVTGSVRFENQARFDAVAYTYGLLKAVIERGGLVYENTRVAELEDGEPVVLRCDGGQTVRATAVFEATHIPLNRLALHTKLRHLQSYVSAWDGVPTPDALYWDTEDPYHYLRVAQSNGHRAFVVGGCDHHTGNEEHTQKSFDHLA